VRVGSPAAGIDLTICTIYVCGSLGFTSVAPAGGSIPHTHAKKRQKPRAAGPTTRAKLPARFVPQRTE